MNPFTWRRWKIKRRLAELSGNEILPKEREIPKAEEPGIDGLPLDESYVRHLRSPGDVVISGPLGEGAQGRHGRWFATKEEALYWAVDKYGFERVSLLDYEGASRWAVLVKNLKR